MRHVLLPMVFVAMSTNALAHPEPASKPIDRGINGEEMKLSSKAEIEDMIDRLPDFNAVIDDVIKLTENDRLQKRIERSGEAFADKLEDSGALEPDENGIPDIKLMLKVVVTAMSDEEVTGGLLETLSELQSVMEKHIPEEENLEVE